MDFFRVCEDEPDRNGVVKVEPDFIVGRSKDLMVRGQSFYAIWDEENKLWCRDDYLVQVVVDKKIYEHVSKLKDQGIKCKVKTLRSNNSGSWAAFRKYTKNLSDNSKPLDRKIVFANTKTRKTDYVSRRLPYPLEAGPHPSWDRMLGTLYVDEERLKIEWFIGAIVSGDSKSLEKFLVFYGEPGSGKGTVLTFIFKMFGGLIPDGGYVTTFNAKNLVGGSSQFALESFKDGPLVAIQFDGDLSRIEDNTKLNMIVSHENLEINAKFAAIYNDKIEAALLMGTNKPVKITDAKSGLVRRLIDVHPSTVTIPATEYHQLKSQIEFEFGAIAHHCLTVYQSKGKHYYDNYRPLVMMEKTDVFYNYVEECWPVFKAQNWTTLDHAWDLFNKYVKDSRFEYQMNKMKFKDELKNYFDEFYVRKMINKESQRNVYIGFSAKPFKSSEVNVNEPEKLLLEETKSLLDDILADSPAQYASQAEWPSKYWTNAERQNKKTGEMFTPKPSQVCSTVLSDIDTSKLHFVKVPENHVVVDFDLKDEDGNKSLELNLQAAALFPPTYAELSKGGGGLHLHYDYEGDVTELSNVFSEGIEVKTLLGDSGLRRKLTLCNSVPVATIGGGLPLKEKKMINEKTLKSELSLRKLIEQNLRKEHHPGTKPSMDFIEKILNDAYDSGMVYDISDMESSIIRFAAMSHNQKIVCLGIANRLKYASEKSSADIPTPKEELEKKPLIFIDVEVYKNLFVVCWKYHGSDTVIRMINPVPNEIATLINKYRFVGYNNRPYDNHMLWGRYVGMTNEELYVLSQKIIVDKDRGAFFPEAYNLSYADLYDISIVKMGLKRHQIRLGIRHVEMDIPWDEPVPEDRWTDVADYCANDVDSLEAVWDDLKMDVAIRQVLADLSGLEINVPTRKHVGRILFGEEKKPQSEFVYTDLSEIFPGYEFDKYKSQSTYKGEIVGEGGYVYAEPGMYDNVALLDISSMHPTSIVKLNIFGDYTDKYSELMEARLAIKNKQFERARGMLGGALVKHLEGLEDGAELTEEQSLRVEALSDGLKLALNSTYGWTSARFDNEFRDIRNLDNIVAKRGALFMIDLKHEVQARGFTVAHIKTDSIKIPDATPEIIQFVKEYGEIYGYTFNHEATYEKFCLVNDAVFIAYVGWNEKKKPKHWKAVGAQFQHPYVFKKLFSRDRITLDNMFETKSVQQGVMTLGFEGAAKRTHVGKTGRFIPVTKESGGGQLLRVKDGKDFAVTGTKDHYWVEAEQFLTLSGIDPQFFDSEVEREINRSSYKIDMSHYDKLVKEAIETIQQYDDFDDFVSVE